MELLQCSSYKILIVVFWDNFPRGLQSLLLYRISLLTVCSWLPWIDHEKQKQACPSKWFTKVTFGARAPKYWTPMAIMEEECKLMEVSKISKIFLSFWSVKVRKFSNDYFNVDSMFRRPGLELINAFAVQNPFLWGQYLLRLGMSYLQCFDTGWAVCQKEKVLGLLFKHFQEQ